MTFVCIHNIPYRLIRKNVAKTKAQSRYTKRVKNHTRTWFRKRHLVPLEVVFMKIRTEQIQQIDVCNFCTTQLIHISADLFEHSLRRVWIGADKPIAWPPRSPDLYPVDFLLWIFFKCLLTNTYLIARRLSRKNCCSISMFPIYAWYVEGCQLIQCQYNACLQASSKKLWASLVILLS